MANSTEVIHGLSCKLFRDSEPPIYITPAGSFAAKQGDNWIIKKTLRGLEQALDKGLPSLKLFQIAGSQVYHNCGPGAAIEVVRMTQSHLIDSGGKKRPRGWGDWYIFDQEIVKQLQALEKERAKMEEAIRKKHQALVKKLTQVGTHSFAQVLQQRRKS